jgi:hypothetical protein
MFVDEELFLIARGLVSAEAVLAGDETRAIADLGRVEGAVRRLGGMIGVRDSRLVWVVCVEPVDDALTAAGIEAAVGVEGSWVTAVVVEKVLVLRIAGIPAANPDGIRGTGGAGSSAGTLRPTNCEALRLSSWYEGVFLSFRSGVWAGGWGMVKQSQTGFDGLRVGKRIGLDAWRTGERGVHSFCWFGSFGERGIGRSDASSNVRPGSWETTWAIGGLGSGFSDNGDDRVVVDTVRLNGEDFGCGVSESGDDRVAVDIARLNVDSGGDRFEVDTARLNGDGFVGVGGAETWDFLDENLLRSDYAGG